MAALSLSVRKGQQPNLVMTSRTDLLPRSYSDEIQGLEGKDAADPVHPILIMKHKAE